MIVRQYKLLAVLIPVVGLIFGSVFLQPQPGVTGAPQRQGKRGASPTDQELLATVKAPKEFQVTIFAKPPRVNYPTCLTAAPTGEVFIGIDQNGSLDAKLGRGRILRCVDKDGDGIADEFTVFAEVDSPRGLVWDNGTLYVLHPPNLTAYYDDNGTGKANRSEVLVKGIGRDLKFRGADHTTNGIQLGIDGYLYIAVGDYGFHKAVGKDGTIRQLFGGGVARVRTDGTGLEIFARGQRNIYDVAIDPELNLFTRDNTNDGDGWDVRFSHVVQGAQFGYPSLFVNFPEDHIKPLADYGGGAPTGALFVDESTIPAPYGHALYSVDWGRSEVYRHPLQANGATFKVEQKNFVEIPRPTDMDVDASGRMYIASWRNGGFTYGGPNIGFVACLTPKNYKPTLFPDLKKADLRDLLKFLDSDSHVTRLHTQREILRRGYDKEIAKNLASLARTSTKSAARVAALFTLQQLGKEKAQTDLMDLAKDDRLRPFALRALADDPVKAGKVPTALFVNALNDANPRTRLEAINALGRLDRKEAIDKLLPLAGDSDPVLAHIAVKNLVDLRAWDAALKAMVPGAPTRLLLGCSQILQAQYQAAVVDGLIGKLDQATEPEVRKFLLRALCRLHYQEGVWDGKSWWGTRPDTRGPYFRPVTWEQSPKIVEALMKAVSNPDKTVQASLIADVLRNRIKLDQAVPIVLKLAAADTSFHPVAVDFLLASTKLSPNALQWLEAVAAAPKESPGVRVKALTGLHRLAGKSSNLLPAVAAGFATVADNSPAELLRARQDFLRDPSQGGRAAFWIEETQGKEAARRELAYSVLLSLTMNLQRPPQERDQASAAIEKAWTSSDRTVSLLHAIGRTFADHYGLQVREKLKDSRAEVKAAAQYAAKLIELDAPGKRTGPTIEKLAYEEILKAVAKQKGDAKLGARLFFKQGCVTCHTVSPKETARGPFLGDISVRYKQHEILESILKPSAKIAQGFETQWFILADGRMVEGFVTKESGTEVEIRNLAGIATVLPKADIEKRGRRDTSMMPERLVDHLTLRELASLAAYLDTLRSK